MEAGAMPSLHIAGIPTNWVQFFPIAEQLVQRLFGGIGWPPLKSETIVVINRPDAPMPMYYAGVGVEMIRVTVGADFPWQFGYQLSHELGHLSARSDLRHPRADGLMWIEEAMCECHSLIGMAHLAHAGPNPQHAQSYLDGLLATHALPEDPDWFLNASVALTAAQNLTDEGKVVARYIYASVEPERILSDNRRLIDLPTGVDVMHFLDLWRELVGGAGSVPAALGDLITASNALPPA